MEQKPKGLGSVENRVALAGLTIFVAFMLFEMWGDWTKTSRFNEVTQRDLIKTQEQDRAWALAHPTEAAQRDNIIAKFQTSQNGMLACFEYPDATKAIDCLAQNKRREIMECLNGPDWKDCPAMHEAPR